MSRKHRRGKKWPGGTVGHDVPAFNPENVAHVEESNRNAMMDAFDDLPDAAFFAIADEMGIDLTEDE